MGLDAAMGINSERHRFKNWTKYDPKGLVGHWTFCSKLPSQNLFQDVAGTTPVNADGERIGYVKNEAPLVGDGYGNRLGKFLRSMRDTNSHKPVFKTGTADDCCGWAEFDNTNADTTEGFVGGTLQGEDVTNWGGETSTKFSDLIMNNQNYTMFAVVRPDPADDSNTKSFYYQRGGKVSGDTTNGNFFSAQRTGTEAYTQGYACASCSPSYEQTVTAPFADNDIHLITSVGRAGTNASYISVDQVQLDTETMDTLMNIDFDSQGDQSNVVVPGGAFVSIGYQMSQGNVADAAMAFGFKGRIYEIMVYVGDLLPNEILIVEDYLMKKYCIEPTNPADGRGMVGHWDFTKKIPSSNLTQNVDGTSPVNADGQKIGYAKNFATGETSTGYKLGDFVRASANDATRPTFKTGGQNNHSYADYGSGDTIGLRAGYFTSGDSDDDGGVATNKFSDLTMSSQNYTAFYVVDNQAATGTAAKILDLKGHGQANTDLGNFAIGRGTDGTGDPYFNQIFRDDGIGSYPNNSVNLNDQTSAPWSDGFRIVAVIGDSGPGATRMFIDGTEVFNITQPSDFDITFSKTSNSGTGAPRVGLGCTVNDPGGIVDFGWEGKLYEVMVYKGTLSAADFNNVQTFLENKYNVNQEPVLYTISECVGHWDFTTLTTNSGTPNMFVNRDGTGGLPSSGDYIGKLINQAPGNASAEKLGAFVRSGADNTTRPTFQTGGVNGRSYAQFNGSQGLRAGHFSTADCDDDGGISATVFTNLELNQYSSTTIFVCENDQETVSPSDYVFYLRGNDTNGANDLARWQVSKATGSYGYFTFNNYSASITNQYVYSMSNFYGGPGFILVKVGPGATGMQMFEDGTLTDTAGDAANLSSKKIYLDNTNDGYNFLTLGNSIVNSAGTLSGSGGWTGKIYEIIVYNKVLSDDEIDIVNDYIAAKYGLSIG
jgi:hypothetical protein